MAVFFLLVGLEIERELYIGNWPISKKPCFPSCSHRGMAVPAGFHFFLTCTPWQHGFGIPMATDIASPWEYFPSWVISPAS